MGHQIDYRASVSSDDYRLTRLGGSDVLREAGFELRHLNGNGRRSGLGPLPLHAASMTNVSLHDKGRSKSFCLDAAARALLGIQRDFGLDLRSFRIRGQYEWFDFGNEVDASGFSIGVLFRF